MSPLSSNKLQIAWYRRVIRLQRAFHRAHRHQASDLD